jgi:hypothetical protein
MPYDTPPTTATISLEDFKVSITDSQLEELQQLLRLGRLPRATYENAVQQEGQFGVTREWMSSTRDYWADEFDWQVVARVPSSDGLASLRSPFPQAQARELHQQIPSVHGQC